MVLYQYRQPLLAVALFLFIFHQGYSQTGTVRIMDAQSGQLIPFSGIQLEPLEYHSKKIFLHPDSGIFKNPVSVRSLIKVSSLGYITLIDTLQPNQSQTIRLKPDPLQVNEVVVTGQLKPVRSDKSIYRIDVISNQQIHDKAATNLTELLINETNLRINQDASLGASINIQGLSGQYVKILIDGIPMIGRQDGILDLSQVSLANVDHVELVEGPMSVIYGSDALAGTINIITKKTDQIKGKYIGKINSYYETVGIYNFDGNLSFQKDKNSFTINGGRNFFGGYSATDTSRAVEWKPKLQYFGNFDYNYIDPKNIIRLGADYFYEELRNNGNLYDYEHAKDEYDYTTRINLKGNYLRKFRNDKQLLVTTAYSYFNKTVKTTIKDLVTLSEALSADPTSQDTTRFYDWMSRITYSETKNTWINYQAGVDASTEKVVGKRVQGEQAIDDVAAFLSTNFFPEYKLNFQSGVRAIYDSKFKAPFVYSLNLKYTPITDIVFRASYGKGFRSPTLKELYLDFIDSNHHVYGNDTLKAEFSNNVNISTNIIHHIGKQSISLDASLFYNSFHNKIDYLYDPNDPTWAKIINIPGENFITKGLELQFLYNFRPGFNVSTGMFVLGQSHIADIHNFNYSTDYSFGLNYQHPATLIRVCVFYKLTGSYTVNTVSKEITGTPLIQNAVTKGYQTLNLTLSRSFFNNRIDATVGLKNILNVKDVTRLSSGASGDPHTGTGNSNATVGYGRTFFIQLSYNFIKF